MYGLLTEILSHSFTLKFYFQRTVFMKDDRRRTQVISVEEIFIIMEQDCQAIRKKEKRFNTGETQIKDKECVLQSLRHMSLSCIQESCMV